MDKKKKALFSFLAHGLLNPEDPVLMIEGGSYLTNFYGRALTKCQSMHAVISWSSPRISVLCSYAYILIIFYAQVIWDKLMTPIRHFIITIRTQKVKLFCLLAIFRTRMITPFTTMWDGIHGEGSSRRALLIRHGYLPQAIMNSTTHLRL